MKRAMGRKHYYFVVFCAAIWLLAVLILPSNPMDRLPGQDNGVFLYGGQQLLAGKTPYVDFWDHKGPLIFYINALGLLIGSGSRWGVWILEFVFLLSTALGLFRISSERLGFLAGCVIVCIWIYSMKAVGSYYHFRDSNYIETYGLLFNVWAIAVWLRGQEYTDRYAHYLWIGILTGLSLALRPNNIAVQVSILVVELIVGIRSGQSPRTLKRGVYIVSGILMIIAPIVIIFAVKGGLRELYDAVIHYNLVYSQKNYSGESVLNVIQLGLVQLDWLPAIGYVGLLAILAISTFSERQNPAHSKVFRIFLLIGWPMEVLFSAVSGRALLHYYINWTPYVGLLLGETIFTGISWLKRYEANTRFLNLVCFSALVLSLALNRPAINKYLQIAENMVVRRAEIEDDNTIVDFIRDNTYSRDRILVWGNDVWINFLSDRESPSKYSYQYALFMPGYTDSGKVLSFLQDLSRCPPAYIIEPVVDTDEILPLNRERLHRIGSESNLPAGMNKVYEYVNEYYRFVWESGDTLIYEWNGYGDEHLNCQ